MKTGSYFPHDSNAKDDPKCMLLIDQLGLEGYGIFWMLIETLRDQPDFSYPLSHTSILAKRYNTSKEKIEIVIQGFNLFQISNDIFFYSESLINRMGEIANKKLKQSEGGKKAMLNRWKKNQLQLPEKDIDNKLLITDLEEKNKLLITRKGKERKVKKKNIYTEPELFYNDEIENNEKSEYLKEYIIFKDFLFGKNKLGLKMEGVLSIKNQVTYKQFEILFKKSKEIKYKFSDFLPTMDNDPSYYKNKTHLSKCIHTWLNNHSKFSK